MAHPRKTLVIVRSLIFLLFLTGWRPSEVAAQSVPFGAISFTGQGISNQASNTVMSNLISSYRYTTRYVYNTYNNSGGSDVGAVVGRVASRTTTYAFIDGLRQPTLSAAAGGQDLTAVPVFVVPVACIYNLPYAVTSAANTLLQLNSTVLAKIFSGAITQWNDPSILQLNPSSVYLYSTQLASLNEPIRVIVRSDPSLATEAFTRFMADGDAAFASSPGVSDLPDWGSVPNATASSESNMKSTVASTSYSIGFVLWSTYLSDSSSIAYARMRNKVGTSPPVSPTQTTAAALSFGNVAQFDTANHLLIANLTDGGLANTWPIGYFTYIVVRTSIPDKCQAQTELSRWITWLASNPQVSTLAWQSGYATPHFSVIKRVMDALGALQCNDSAVQPSKYIIGSGASLPVLAMQWWMNLYEIRTPSVMLTYISEGSSAGKSNIRGTSAGPNTDFGASDAPLTATEYTGTGSDLQMLPALAAAVVFVYNVPELSGQPTLILSRSVAANIYLGNITKWNDPAIAAINPDLASILPNQDIKVAGRSDGSGTTDIFTSALSRFDPVFNSLVGPSELVNWGNSASVNAPAKNLITPNTRYIVVSGTSGMVNGIKNNQYSIGYVVSSDAINNGLSYATMINKAGTLVTASGAGIRSALGDYAGQFTDRFTADVTDGNGTSSWPITGYSYFIVRRESMIDCSKAQTMLDFILWTQTESEPIDAADTLGYSVTPIAVRRQFLIKLSNVTCAGKPVFSYVPCLQNGIVCSDHGTCLNGKCICESGWTGNICQTRLANSTSSSDDTAAIAAGVAVPLGVLLLCCIVVMWIVTVVVISRRSRRGNNQMEWVIPYSELEVGELIAIGGYGEVRKAEWKGSTVAIKLLAAHDVSRDVQDAFTEEMQVMMNLRHPNIILFMGAVVKPPNMCIVMEYMEIGSLYDVIHNELLSDEVLTLPKRLRIASEACKGLHFLHASGICHRDLKSLNVLLDSNWNVKIGDFGLTKVKGRIGRKKLDGTEDAAAALPSVHWTAPEVLENPEASSKASDIYSFGIIMWELITREDPYDGMSPTVISVKVMRDSLRPVIPDTCPEDLSSLISICWAQDPTDRPDCTEVTSRLQTMYRYGSSRSGQSSTGSSSNVYYAEGFDAFAMEKSSMRSVSSDGSAKAAIKTKAPQGTIAIAFTDITKAAALWEFAPAAMRDATIMHNQCIRATLQKYGGYEATISKEGGEGSFCVAFQDIATAVQWAATLQEDLMKLDWPAHLLTHPAAAEEWDAQNTVIFKGLRVRIGIHYGDPRVVQDPLTKRIEYIGPHMSLTAHLTTLAKGGQILLSNDAYKVCSTKAELQELGSFVSAGRFEISNLAMTLYEYRPSALITRFVGETGTLEGSMSSSAIDVVSTSQDIKAVSEEVAYLTSANLCRWIINFNQIQLGRQIGMGSYGLVYQAKWKGVDVAVKKFIKQKMNERRLLEIRAEAALLSELHHPHIVMFIGACMKQPNLCIITEYMQRGNLRDILRDKTVIMPWNMRMTIAKSIGLALRYLHTLEPVIIHRDLKSSNILVDENWNVKVADFGFARLREENATMTRCGTPCWTAPEVLRGEEYNEKADIYSFGMILWELLTRAVPYEDQNFISVTMDVLRGVRPKIPPKTDPQLELLIMECWDEDPKRRPKLTKLLRYFATALNEPESSVV